MIATTIEQSKHLLELGLDPKTTDMMWEQHRNYESPILTVPPHTTIGRTLGGHCCSTWSLSALLEVMPKRIIFPDEKGKKHICGKMLTYAFDKKKYCLSYETTLREFVAISVYGDTLIDVAYDAMCWLLVNWGIKKED